MFRCASCLLKAKKMATCIVLLLSANGLHAASEGEVATQSDNISTQQANKQHSANSSPSQDRQQDNVEIIPPPPPGPYMSTALKEIFNSAKTASVAPSANIVKTQAAKGPSKQPGFKMGSSDVPMNMPMDMPMDMFSPDRPWPTNLRPHNFNSPNSSNPPNRGASFTAPSSTYGPNMNWPDPRNYPPNYNQGNRGYSDPRTSGAGAQQYGSQQPYYGPSNYGSDNRRPAANNYGTR